MPNLQWKGKVITEPFEVPESRVRGTQRFHRHIERVDLAEVFAANLELCPIIDLVTPSMPHNSNYLPVDGLRRLTSKMPSDIRRTTSARQISALNRLFI